jgi:DNA-binding NtrC family response regulator
MVADFLQSDADSTPDNDIRGQAISPQEINVLASQADWDWPGAVRDIFRPRGVNLLVADSTNDIVNVLRQRRIRTAIVDTDREQAGLWTLKIIRLECPSIPCILLASNAGRSILDEALRLDAFSVIDKPVDMRILRDLLNRLFVKRYGSHIFSS